VGCRDLPRLLQYAYSSTRGRVVGHRRGRRGASREGCTLISPEDEARGLGLKHWLKPEGFDPSGFPAPSGLDGLRVLRRKRGMPDVRILRNLKPSEFRRRMEDSKVSRLDRVWRRVGYEPHLHSLESAYMGEEDNIYKTEVSKEAFEGSEITVEEWTEFLGVLSERHKVNWHAKHKPLYVPKEHTLVYLSVHGGFVKKRYQAKKGG